MEAFWRNVGVQLGKHWKVVAGVVLAITVLLGIGLTRVEFATGQDSYLNPDSQIALDNVEFQGNFGGETVIMLMSANRDGVDVADLVTGDNLAMFERLTDQLAAVPNVSAVITPPVSLGFSDALVQGPGRAALISAAARDVDGASVRGADIQVGLARLGAIDDQTLGDPAWNDLLIYGNDGFMLTDGELQAPADADRLIRLSLAGTFPDAQTGVAGVVLDGNLDLDSQSAATEQILGILDGVELDGFDLTVTGSPVYLKEINDYLKGGMLTLGAIALGVMAVVLALMFRVRWRLLPLLAVFVGVLWTFSIVGLIGIDLSLVRIPGLPTLIDLGIADGGRRHAFAVGDVDLHQPLAVEHLHHACRRDVGGVVEVVPEHLALGRHHADHAELHVADAHARAERVVAPEQLALQARAEDDQRPCVRRVLGRQEAADLDRQPERRGEVGADAIDSGIAAQFVRFYLRRAL